jgi:hypothetical protein
MKGKADFVTRLEALEYQRADARWQGRPEDNAMLIQRTTRFNFDE